MRKQTRIAAMGEFCGRTRRQFLWEAGAGFAGTALAGLLEEGFFAEEAHAADGVSKWKNPLAPKKPHFEPKAKSVIFLYMYGGAKHNANFHHKTRVEGKGGQNPKTSTVRRGRAQKK